MIKYMRCVESPGSGGTFRAGAIYMSVGLDLKFNQRLVKRSHDINGQTLKVRARLLVDWEPQRGDRVEYIGPDELATLSGPVNAGVVMTLLEPSEIDGSWITESAVITPKGDLWRPVLCEAPLEEDKLPALGHRPDKPPKDSTGRWGEI